jgi:biopolymer transport protein ExbD
MKSRRAFLMTLTAGVMALAVIAAPVIADELFGVITKVDVAGKKLTVEEKGSDKAVEVTVTDDTEYVNQKGDTKKVNLEQIAKYVEKAQGKGRKGVPVKVDHEKGVASKITAVAKKKAAP